MSQALPASLPGGASGTILNPVLGSVLERALPPVLEGPDRTCLGPAKEACQTSHPHASGLGYLPQRPFVTAVG